MEVVENVHHKNISYLRARDPSILAWGYHLAHANARNLGSELERTCSSKSFELIPDTEDVNHFQVYLRIKKCDNFGQLYEIVDDATLLCKVPEGAQCIRNLRDGSRITKKFTFSKIFDAQSMQTDLFNGVVKEKVLHFINGYNCTLLTYGASGSGKTFTIVGTAEEPGIIPRALEYLFRTLPQLSEDPRIKPTAVGGVVHLTKTAYKLEKNARQSLLKGSNTNIDRAQHARTYRAMQQRLSNEPVAVIMDDISDVSLGVWVSFAEIYNEYVYDLLKPAPPRGQQKQKLRLGYCNGNAYIKDLTCISVSSGLEAYQILQYGLHNLKYAATLINDHSSRSHSIFTIKLAQASNTDEGFGVSMFNFCDLAGSERLKNTHNVGERLKESNNINTSLLVLARCVSLIRESQKNNDNRLIPFRESKLTQLFQKALLGQEAIAMIVNINPVREMFDESQHVLNFSAVAKHVIVEEQQLIRRPCKNRFSDYMARSTEFASADNQNEADKANVEELQHELSQLTNELVQQKLDAEEEREHVVSTYKKILDDTNRYWESRCQDLQDLLAKNMRKSRESYEQQAKKPRLTVINLDSSTEEEDGDLTKLSSSNCAEKINNANNLIILQNELQEVKSQLEISNMEKEKLHSEKKSMEATLKDAEKTYEQLRMDYESQLKEIYSQFITQQEQIVELNTYIEQLHKNKTEACDVDEEKQASELSTFQEKVYGTEV